MPLSEPHPCESIRERNWTESWEKSLQSPALPESKEQRADHSARVGRLVSKARRWLLTDRNWLGCMCLAALIPLVAIVVHTLLHPRKSDGFGYAIGPLMGLLLVLVALLVGLDARAKFRKQKPSLASAVLTVVGSIGSVAFLAFSFTIVYNSTRADYAENLLGKSSVRLIPGRPDIEIIGGLLPGLSEEVRELLNENPQVEIVYLTSTGGVGEEGRRISDLIRERNLSTYVPRYCYSACTMAFSAGRSRMIMSGAQMGYHRSGLIHPLFGDLSLPRWFNQKNAEAFLRAGISQRFVDRYLDTAFSDVWIPTEEEMLEANVVTSVVGDDRFAMSGLVVRGVDADRGQVAGMVDLIWEPMEMMRKLRPEERRAVQDIILASYDAGESFAEMKKRVSRHAASVLAPRIAAANDATMVEIGHILYAAMAKLEGIDDVRCVAVGKVANLFEAGKILSGEGFNMFPVIGDLVTRTPMHSEEREGMSFRSHDGHVPSDEIPEAGCSDVMARYAHALSLPDAEGSGQLRTFLLGH